MGAMSPAHPTPAPATAPATAPDATEGNVAAAALQWLAQRHSVGPRHLTLPVPTDAEWAQAAALARRAPDHLQLRPYRFVRVREEQRADLAQLFTQVAQRRGLDAAGVADAHQRAYNGPALVALVVRLHSGLPAAPEHEQWLAAGAALMNFINALHLQGYGAKVLSGATLREPEVQARFCDAGEQLVAWVAVGTPTRRAQEKTQTQVHTRAVLEDWASAAGG